MNASPRPFPRLDHVLVGFDGSSASLSALGWSAAAAAGGRLTVVFVDATPNWVELVYTAGTALGGIGAPALDGPERVAERMRHAITAVSSDVAVTSLVRRGRVATELARAAEERQAVAIVVGTDVPPPQRFGRSVATRISRRTAIPVIAVG